MLQTPSHLAPQHAAYIARLITEGHPIAIFGCPAGGVDPGLAQLGGLGPTSDPGEDRAAVHFAKFVDAPQALAQHIPETFATFYRLKRSEAAADARVFYEVEGNPVLTLKTAEGKRVLMWDPPDVMFKDNAPLREEWGGSGEAYGIVAGALNSLLSSSQVLHVHVIGLSQTMNVTAWRGADGKVKILAANLEEGLRDDADMTRRAVIVLPESWKATQWIDAWTQQSFEFDRGRLKISLTQAGSVLIQPASQ